MSTQNKIWISFLTILLISVATISTANAETTEPQHPVSIDLPILDLPFNNSRYFPDYFSMRQSLAYSTDFYENIHWLLAGTPENHNSMSAIFWVALFDIYSSYTPLGNSWMHEEWHRSVLTHRGFGSFNDVNTFPFGKTLIAVSHVDDQDLVDLKRDHPADQVRLSSAGMESQTAQNLLMERHHFFEKTQSFDRILQILNAVNVSSYMSLCASGEADRSTDKQNHEDGADLSRRDFTGLDCTAWVYDLFRPDEPYTARGTHPSGVGLDRYIRYSDLNQKEKDFLHQQMMFSFLNFADPFLFNFNEFHSTVWDQDIRWNLRLAHYLTSFGGTIDTVLFLETALQDKWLLTWHHGMTDTRYFPGFTIESLDRALPWNPLFLSTSLTVWPQPQKQRVEETRMETLVDAAVTLSYQHSSKFASYFGLEAKTAGWMAGNVYLEPNLSVWTGVKLSAF